MPEELMTTQGEALLTSNETPWNVYPRPQMKRDSFLNLNGFWEFSAGKLYADRFRVPFCPESRLSNIATHFPEGTPLEYRRCFVLPEGFHKGRVLLHIGAADQIAEVTVNGHSIGRHVGGYEAFSFDITDALTDPAVELFNVLCITCWDDLRDKTHPYGKQVRKRGGMWYTPVSGIWQTVWLESVPERYIEKLNIENKGYSVTVSVEPALSGKVIVPALGEFTLENCDRT